MVRRKKINTRTKLKPYKGCKFLKSVPIGRFFKTTTGLVGKVLNRNEGSVLCRFIKTQHTENIDMKYWIGDKRISPDTNVKQVRRQDA
tara:strand:+ start:298 stop:561 length:264 start_codon:yes stop_codon:yes gene_type:complete